MAEAKLAPNLPDWMVEHANRYISSGGTDGHMYKATVPGRGELTVPSLLLTTTGRKSGDRFVFPLFYGNRAATATSSSPPRAARRSTPAGTATSSPTPRWRCRSAPRS